nr:MAG TPA: hypothetical protein [Caudoviricetes sp.]
MHSISVFTILSNDNLKIFDYFCSIDYFLISRGVFDDSGVTGQAINKIDSQNFPRIGIILVKLGGFCHAQRKNKCEQYKTPDPVYFLPVPACLCPFSHQNRRGFSELFLAVFRFISII